MTCTTVAIDFRRLDFTHLAPEYVEPYSTPHSHGADRQYVGESEFLRLFGIHVHPTIAEGIQDITKIFRGIPLTTPFNEEDLASKLVESKMTPSLESAKQLVPFVLTKRFCETEHYGHYQIEQVPCKDGNKKYQFRQNMDSLIFPK